MDIRRRALCSYKNQNQNSSTYDYFTIVSLSDNNSISFARNGSKSTEYSIDGGITWETLASGYTLVVNQGTEIKLRNTDQTINNLPVGLGQIHGSKAYRVKGNIMSLLFGDDFIGRSLLQYYDEDNSYHNLEFVFRGLFEDETTLIDAGDLVLPATTLSQGCYSWMFRGCTSLRTTPQLPATKLAESCYNGMFQDCKSLSISPELPATTLAESCYLNMFSGCTSLYIAPELPAQEMTGPNCYQRMFYGNTSLVKAPTELPAMMLSQYCYYGMFEGCTLLTESPVLPATTLTNNCYAYMFNDCRSLNKITMLATDISAANSLDSWVSGVADEGIFIKNPEMTSLSIGDGGIPTGWVEEDYQNYHNNPFTITSLENNTSITISNYTDQIYYSKNGGNWTEVQDSSTSISLNNSETVSFYSEKLNNGIVGQIKATSGSISVSGNIMSLIYGLNFIGKTDLSNFEGCFSALFYQNNSLKYAHNLILPATKLSYECYYYMFAYCMSLKTVPSLPATNLAENCYREMFEGCNVLTTPPQLLATELKNGCYGMMFYRCSNLTTSPILPAETLVSMCYYNMFQNCDKLNYITMLATDISAANSLDSWVSGVASIGTFIKDPGMTSLPTNNVDGIPPGWTVYNLGETITINPPSTSTTTTPEPTDPFNGYAYIDLGLPSGTLWAEYNIGSERESDYGLYFAWGETVGYKDASSGKEFKNGSDYKFGVDDNPYEFTKYHPDVDSLTTLLPEDDAASVNMGGSWRMPSKEELEELINSSYTTTTWTTVNGVYGGKITSKANGNTLFLPGAGYCSWGSVNGVGSYGYGCYWSSSLNESLPEYAHRLFFSYDGDISVKNGYRFEGLSVRGVIGGKNEGTTTTTTTTPAPEITTTPTPTITTPAPSGPITDPRGCLTFEALDNNVQVSFSNNYQYCIDYSGDWIESSGSASTINAGQTISIKNSSETTYSSSTPIGTFYLNGRCNVKGNVRSLLNTGQYLWKTCFAGLFSNCSMLISAKDLILPDLDLISYCYRGMFSGCTSLTEAPVLPATTLAEGCYSSMFEGCTSLTEAPELPATTLELICYTHMFYNCSRLSSITMLADNIINIETAFDFWVFGVASYGSFYKKSTMNYLERGYNGIPSGWDVYDYGSSTPNPETTTTPTPTITTTPKPNSGSSTTTTTPQPSNGSDDNSGETENNTTTTSIPSEGVITTSPPNNSRSITSPELTKSEPYIDLNDNWQLGSTSYSDYYGVYQSFSNKGLDNTAAIMYITITNYSEFTLLIRSYAESNYDYVMVSQLDKSINNSTSYSDSSLVKAHTRGNQVSSTSPSSYTSVTFTGIPEGEHTITIVYRKDGSNSQNDDRGYVLIPKNQ